MNDSNRNFFRILVVEDNDTMREGMTAVLRKEGYTVEETSTGAGALALVVFSLLTKPEGEEQVRNFRARIEQSSEIPGEPSEAGADETAEKGQQLLLVNLLQLKKGARGRSIFHAYRTDLIGIARGWALVAALVIVCWALTKI